MVNLISSFLYELNVDAEESVEEASLILEAIEKKGMLPPETTVKTFNVPGTSVGGTKYYNKWDPDDL